MWDILIGVSVLGHIIEVVYGLKNTGKIFLFKLMATFQTPVLKRYEK